MLSAQLAQSVSLNARSLKDHKSIESYLFSSQQARQHDLDTVFQLAQNGLQLLATSSSSLKTLKSPLLSSPAKFSDRTRLSPEENHILDDQIKDLLFAISPFLTEQGASTIIEWLVRRYRANEFNVDTLLTVFLPYHNTPHFVKLVSILHIKPSSPWAFLNAHKKAIKPLHRDTLVSEMLKNQFLAASVVDILSIHVSLRCVHRAVVTFVVAVTMEYLSNLSIEGVHLSFLIPSLLTALENAESAEVSESCLLLVGYLASRVRLDSELMEAIMASLSCIKAQPDPRRFIKGITLILQSQNDSMALPEPLLRAILILPNVQQVIQDCWETISNPSFLQPFSHSLALQITMPLAYDMLSRLSMATNLNRDGVVAITSAILRVLADCSEDARKQKLSIVLSKLYQRYPDQVDLVSQSLADQDSAHASWLTGIDSSRLESPPVNDSVDDDAVVLLTNGDRNQRIRGLQSILKAVPSMTDANDLISEALVQMVQGYDHGILQILYADPQALSHLIASDLITETLVRVIKGASEDRAVDTLSIHTDFIGRWMPDNPEHSLKLGLAISVHLLLTKSKFRHSVSLWRSISNSISPIWREGLFSGVEALYISGLEGLKGEAAEMAAFNEQLISLLAGNILRSTHCGLALSVLTKELGAPTSGMSEVHAVLIIHQIIRQGSDDRGWELGVQILDALDYKDMSFFRSSGFKMTTTESSKKPDSLRVVSKTDHESTRARIYAALLLLLPSIPNPPIGQTNWMAELGTTPESQFSDFRRRLYIFLNINQDLDTFAPLVLREIFTTSQKETFFFLASIWSSSKANHDARLSSLKHGRAMLRALVDQRSGSTWIDLQVLLPLLFPALLDPSRSIRNGAIDCIKCLAVASLPGNTEVAEIYGLECLPTTISASLKILTAQDFATYTKDLMDRLGSIDLDPESFTKMHVELLTPSSEDSSRELSGVQDPSKLTLLDSLLKELATPQGLDGLNSREGGHIYVKQLVEIFGVADSAHIEQDSLLSAFINLLNYYFSNPQQHSIALPVLSAVNALTSSLNPTQRLNLARELLSTPNPTPPVELIQVLSTTMDLESVANALIQEICMDMPSHHSPKRQRTESDGPVPKISKLCQALMSSSVVRSPLLLKHLLQCLEQTTSARGLTRTESIHLQGVLVTALIHVSQFVPPTAVITPQLRIDVLVNLIKDSAQPHLVHQALLLIAALVPWSSDSLLHHILPILVSTGSYISPRDDVYSARVAEKTIDSVIPVMTTYLRNQHPKRSALQVDIFIDAVDGIPSHRRTSFFVHLLSVLGTVDFTVPICLLLMERVESWDSKNQSEKFDLAVSLIHSLELNNRIAILSDMIEDILADINSSRGEMGSFISSLRKEAISSPLHALRLIKILDFTRNCLESCKISNVSLNEEQSQRLLSALVRLQSVVDGTTLARGDLNLPRHVQGAVFTMLKLVPSSTMMFTCVQLLRTNDEMLQVELFALLAKHLPSVSKEARELISDSIKLLLSSIKDIVANSSDAQLVSAAYRALKSVAITSRPQEFSGLTELVPLVVSGATNLELGSTAIDALSSLCTCLGPRLLTHITMIVEACCMLIVVDRPPRISITSISTLRQLLETSSAFWTRADLESFISSYMESIKILNGESKDALASLARQMARRISRQEFIGALASSRGRLKAQTGTISAEKDALIFSLLVQCLRGSGKSRIDLESRAVLGLLMDSWDEHETLPDNAASFKAFTQLTTKLNENSFKPLHRILFDWAWTAGEEATLYSRECRAIHYCQAMSGVIVILKGLMTPYLSPFLARSTDLLNLWSQKTEFALNPELWKRIIGLIEQAAHVDDGTLWRDDVTGAIASALVRQLGYSTGSRRKWMIVNLGDCISAVGSVMVDAAHLKAFNIELLMHTRSEETAIRLGALECAHKLWVVNGPRLIGWKHETIPFLHECADDENDEVMAKARDFNAFLDSI
ncbi:SubName: Full=Uncharacterized protein {ECO:0000313/EMBL:CCA66475.1} [Serendipita indica DSM 11827]|nr:SubName: Full=Uncharacterized protein {ECO:0000313/EMBL:CCA66475.1} [Serendipita indica DSM 11827]